MDRIGAGFEDTPFASMEPGYLLFEDLMHTSLEPQPSVSMVAASSRSSFRYAPVHKHDASLMSCTANKVGTSKWLGSFSQPLRIQTRSAPQGVPVHLVTRVETVLPFVCYLCFEATGCTGAMRWTFHELLVWTARLNLGSRFFSRRARNNSKEDQCRECAAFQF